MSFSFFSPTYVDNYWIKDRTFFSDMKLGLTNAALGSELNMLHSWSFNNPFGITQQYDIGSLLAGFWDTAYKNANATFSMNMMNMPMMQGFQFPATPGVQIIPPTVEKEPDKELTDEEKKEFQTKKDEFNKLYKEYDELDSETKKALGLDKILKSVKTDYDAESNNTPETMQKCINTLKEKISKIKSEDLKKILSKTQSEGVRDDRIDALYTDSITPDKIYSSLIGASVLKSDNIISELDTTLGKKHKPTLVEVLTQRKESGKEDVKFIKDSVDKVVSTLIERANEDDLRDSESVRNASSTLADKLKAYMEDKKCTQENKTALVEAFENLYKEIKLELARKQDKANLDKIEELPEGLQAKYVDENGNLKEEFRINEKETINFLNGIKKGWINAQELAASGFKEVKAFTNLTAASISQKGRDEVKEEDTTAEQENKEETTESKPNIFKRLWNKVCEWYSTLTNMETNYDVCDPSFLHIKR